MAQFDVPWSTPLPLLASAPLHSRVRFPGVANTQPRPVLLVSSTVDHTRPAGGGLWAVEDGVVRQVDEISTTGIDLNANGDHFLRALHLTDAATFDGAILEYREGAPVRMRQVRGFGDLHDVRFLSTGPTAVACYQNAVVPLLAGHYKPVRLGGEPDSWHLNSLAEQGGQVFATAFRRAGRYRQWAQERQGGLLLCLETKATVIGGLSAPHHPKLIEQGWLVCNSGTDELLLFAPESPYELLARLRLRSWPRGLAVVGGLTFVGESVRRREQDGLHASIAVVSHTEWKVVDRISVPTGEIYDILPATAAAADNISAQVAAATTLAGRYCRSRPLRGHERNRLQPGSAPGPLAVHRYGACLRANLPLFVTPDALVHLDVHIANCGEESFPAKGPHPMTVGFRWFDESGTEVTLSGQDQQMRTTLPRDLPPGHALDIAVRARSPAEEGRYLLNISLVHELVTWVADLEPESAAQGWVTVAPRTAWQPGPGHQIRLIRKSER